MNNNVLIKITDFSKSFGSEKAVNDLSFEIFEGEIFAFLGSNGSGKTTTIRCLLDIYNPDKGTLLINGQKYSHKLNRIIGYLPEERGLYTRAKLNDLYIYFLKLRDFDSNTAQKITNQYFERVGLIEHKNKNISQLSSGMQQKAQIGLAIIHSPKLLILDEPFKGLDPLNRQIFIDMFKELKQKGVTIMYSTHVIDEAQKMADRLIIIKKGTKKAYGSITAVRETFGSNTIFVEFDGKLPINKNLFTADTISGSAEITPESGISTDQILKFLIDQKLKLSSFRVDYPSLNEIFIKIVGKNES